MSAMTLLQLRGLRGQLQTLRDAADLSVERAFSSTSALLRYRTLAPPPARPAEAPVGDPAPELVERYLSEECMPRAERLRLHLRRVAEQHARFEGDCGSSEVQVACLTDKIKAMADHMRAHPKDYSSRRGLEAMLARRRSLLQFLRRTRFDTYAMLIARLGLKDTYAKQDRLTMYKVKAGRAH